MWILKNQSEGEKSSLLYLREIFWRIAIVNDSCYKVIDLKQCAINLLKLKRYTNTFFLKNGHDCNRFWKHKILNSHTDSKSNLNFLITLRTCYHFCKPYFHIEKFGRKIGTLIFETTKILKMHKYKDPLESWLHLDRNTSILDSNSYNLDRLVILH